MILSTESNQAQGPVCGSGVRQYFSFQQLLKASSLRNKNARSLIHVAISSSQAEGVEFNRLLTTSILAATSSAPVPTTVTAATVRTCPLSSRTSDTTLPLGDILLLILHEKICSWEPKCIANGRIVGMRTTARMGIMKGFMLTREVVIRMELSGNGSKVFNLVWV
ncbi:Unknown protein [Striga hermonthica]|uniref:Uncharacterized protein n=1 Tax=Striga hermonthica TaxID=68872 RepID=A0A9N7MI60_STRHE|nr:Unknown protein [Striga hermonthica]